MSDAPEEEADPSRTARILVVVLDSFINSMQQVKYFRFFKVSYRNRFGVTQIKISLFEYNKHSREINRLTACERDSPSMGGLDFLGRGTMNLILVLSLVFFEV